MFTYVGDLVLASMWLWVMSLVFILIFRVRSQKPIHKLMEEACVCCFGCILERVMTRITNYVKIYTCNMASRIEDRFCFREADHADVIINSTTRCCEDLMTLFKV